MFVVLSSLRQKNNIGTLDVLVYHPRVTGDQLSYLLEEIRGVVEILQT